MKSCEEYKNITSEGTIYLSILSVLTAAGHIMSMFFHYRKDDALSKRIRKLKKY